MKKIFFTIHVLLFLFLLTCCNSSASGNQKYSLSYENSSIEIYVGDTINVKPRVSGGKLTLKYELSSDIAEIDSDGNFIANNVGTIIVIVTVLEDPNVKAELTVFVKEKIIDEPIEYTIVLNLDGGILLQDDLIVAKPGDLINLPIPIKEGYDFLGWYDGDKKFDETSMPNKNLYLIARWNKILKLYNITYNLDGGHLSTSAPTTFTENDNIELPIPIKDGFRFMGWYEDEVLITTITNRNYTLIAKWEKIVLTYTITYNLDGGNLSSNAPTTFIEGEIVEIPIPTKDGFRFMGWYEDDILISNISNKNYILTAKWEENTIELNLEAFGGVVNNKTQFDESGIINLPIPILDGYKFKYWCLDSKLTDKIDVLFKNTYNGEKLYAVYELDNNNLQSSIIITRFNRHVSDYDEVVLFDSTVTGMTSRYWHKILIIEENGKYFVSNIGNDTTKLSDLGYYDYLILAYSSYENYQEIVNLNCEIGYEVNFLVDPLNHSSGDCTNIISFSKRNLELDVQEIYNSFNEKYSSIDKINKDIELIDEYNYYNIEWKTSNREALTADGKYIKPFVDRLVTLEAYIGDSKIYEFEVLVEGENKESKALSTGYIYTPYTTITQTAMDCLDIIYCAFLNLDSNGDWTNLKTMTNNINNYIRDKAEKSGTRIVISINQKNSGDFSSVAASPELREKVANNILNVIKTLDLDGVDIDWETPSSNEAGNFTLFMKAIYEKVKTENQEYIVTAAIGGGKWAPPKYDLTNSIKYLDYINMMTYSMATGSGYYQNSLYPSTRSRTLVSCSIDESIVIYNNLGIPNNKILVGIPFYTTVQTECEGVGTKTGNGKSIWYDKLFTTYALSDTMKEYFDDECCVPYRYDASNKIFISFDNEQSIKMKCDYVNSLGLAGTMYWQYGQDVNDMLSLAIAKYINA